MDKRQTGTQGGARLTAAVLLGAMAVSWSSGFIGYRYAADHSGVMLASFWRFLLAALVLLPWGVRTIRTLGARRVLGQALIGVFAIAGFLVPISKAIEWGLAPGTAALIANLLPVVIVSLAMFVPGQRASASQLGGLAVCLAGMLVSGLADLQAQSAAYWLVALPVVGVLSLAVSSVCQQRLGGADASAFGALFIQICAALPIFGVLAAHEDTLLPSLTPPFLFGVGWLVVFSTLGGYGFYWLCLRRYSMQAVSAALFLSPVVTLAWASLSFDAPMTGWGIAGATITVLGVWIFSVSGRKKSPARIEQATGDQTSSSRDLSA
jgi:drug/metabolite transporter (DMT)-like permease